MESPSIGSDLNQPIDFEDYSNTSKSYDDSRIPIGLEVILGGFASAKTQPLHKQVILDAGCGTGNYLRAVVDKVGRCVGLDVNKGMLSQARTKVGDHPDVDLKHGSLLDLPFEDGSFDGIMCNQVIHHLDDPEDDSFPNLKRLFSEWYRVLRAGGVIVLNTCSRQQLEDGFWWADMMPQAVEEMSNRFPSLESTVGFLEDAGFTTMGNVVPLDGVLQGPSYLDPTGPMRASFRDGDSIWSLLSKSELEGVMENIKNLNEKGKMEEYLEGREEKRRQIGQSTFILARKGGNSTPN